MFLTFGAAMRDEAEAAALAVKTTLLVAGAQEGRQAREDAAPPQDTAGGKAAGETGELDTVSRKIAQEQLLAYSEVSGDRNPLHLDAEFAAQTQFGGIIAHGMLTLAFVSEMMASSVGKPWLTSGSVRARFKGAAYPGDSLETWGKASKSDAGSQSYSIALRNSATGDDLIAGTAAVRKI